MLTYHQWTGLVLDRDFCLPKFQDIVRLKFWKSSPFLNFRKTSVYIHVNFICLSYKWDQNVLLQNSANKNHVRHFENGVLEEYWMHCKHNYWRYHKFFVSISNNMLILLMGQHYHERWWSLLAFSIGQFHRIDSRYNSLGSIWKLRISKYFSISQAHVSFCHAGWHQSQEFLTVSVCLCWMPRWNSGVITAYLFVLAICSDLDESQYLSLLFLHNVDLSSLWYYQYLFS